MLHFVSFLNAHGYSNTFTHLISQHWLGSHNFEEDYLLFLEQYLYLLQFHQDYSNMLVEEYLAEHALSALSTFPLSELFVSGYLRKILQILPLANEMAVSLCIKYSFFNFIPLFLLFLKLYIYISLVYISSLNLDCFFDIFIYFDLLYSFFLKFDTVEELRMFFVVLNFYNFDLLANILFISLKYGIYPFYTFLNCTREYFFFTFGLSTDFAISYILLTLVYITGRGTIISDLEKTSAYECGFDPFKDSRQLTDINFFRVAILFILFDVEIIFLLPWIFDLYFCFFDFYFIVGGFIYLYIISLGLFFEYKSKILEW